MAYTKENKLRRIIDIQQCFKQHYGPGIIIEWIYKEKIYPSWKISRSTFMAYLKYPAQKELDELLNNKTNQVVQTQLFNNDRAA